MKVVFMGTPDFSVPALQAIASQNEVVAVYAQPPRAAGRGQKPRPVAVAKAADALGIEVHAPRTLRDQAEQAAFAALDADVAVVVAYGLILPQPILDAPRFGCINIHGSLLPRWRGAAPIHRAVMAGDSESGITIMQMDAGLDTGPMLIRAATAIGPDETTGDLHDRLSGMGAAMIADALDRLPLPAAPQPEAGVTYAHKVDKAEARVDWTRPAVEVDRLIRGLSPHPGAWTMAGTERLKLLRSRVAFGSGPPGEVLQGLTIACGSGAVEILEAQREGKRPLPSREILRGMDLPQRLGP